MSKPKNKQPNKLPSHSPSQAVLSRAKELIKCESEMVSVFEKYHVVLPEAIFIFEKIKFTSLHTSIYGMKHQPVESSSSQLESSEMMFR